MSKVTSKLQVTIPKGIADQYGIRPGDEVRWEIREPGPMMVPGTVSRPRLTPEERVALFRSEMARLEEIQGKRKWPRLRKRDWTREGIYEEARGLPR